MKNIIVTISFFLSGIALALAQSENYHSNKQQIFHSTNDADGVVTPHVIVESGGESGGLTDLQLRASPVPVTGSLDVAFPDSILVTGSVSITNLPATQPVSGTLAISNFPATQPVTGTFWQATQPVSGTFWQATQPVSIASMPSTPVTGTFWQATQPVSGTVAVSNFPASEPVTGTFWQATQPVSLAIDTPDVTDRAARLLGHVTIDNASLAVTGTFWQATQPVSGTFWQATQPVSIASMPTTAVTGTFWQATQPVSGTFWQATQPVSLATNAPDVTDRAARLLGHVTVDAAPTTAVTGTFWQATQPVSGTFWQATQPVSGTVSANASQTGTWTVQPGNTANTTAWKVDGSAVTQPVSGTVSANASQTGTWTVQPGNTANTTAWKVDGSAVTQPVSGTFWQSTQPVSLSGNQAVNVAQVNGNTTAASVTGVQNVTPIRRTGSTGLAPNYSASHITTKTTTTVTAATAYVSSIAICVTGAGTSQTLTIVNKEGTVKTIYTAGAAIAVGNTQLNFTEPILMTSGIDIVTGGTTAGTQDVFITYWQ